MPTPEDVKARVSSAYNAAADFYDDPSNGFWGRYGRRTVERLGIRPGARVLDLCCGTGASALPAARTVGPEGRVVAVDLCERLVALGTAKALRAGLDHLEFRVGDVLSLDLDAESFDYVICVFGIFFMPDMPAALLDMWRFVAPGGDLSVTTWGPRTFEPLNAAFWGAVNDIRPELDKAFHPWDRISEPSGLREVFSEAKLPVPEVVPEAGLHSVPTDRDAWALVMGSGYRGTFEQLTVPERVRVRDEVLSAMKAFSITMVETNVVYSTCRK